MAKTCDKIGEYGGDGMFSRKKMLDILLVSLLLAFAIIISFFNLVFDGPCTESFGATLAFVAVFTTAAVIAYLLRDRVVTVFIASYFSFLVICLVFGLVAETVGMDYNIILLLCSLAVSPFYGFMYIAESIWLYAALVASVVIVAVAVIFSAFPKQTDKK